ELLRMSERLRSHGWSVSDLEGAGVQRFQAPAAEGSSARAEWTRLSLDVARGSARGRLLPPRPAGGEGQGGRCPATQGALTELMAALAPDADPGEPGAAPDDDGGPQAEAVTAATCLREYSSCTGGNRYSCCVGLGCYGPDNHETCQCSRA